MKFSEAILKGYKANGGQQCVDECLDDKGRMCVLGAFALAVCGDADIWPNGYRDVEDAFEKAWGIDPVNLNNNYNERGPKDEPFPWEHIYGMAVAAGL